MLRHGPAAKRSDAKRFEARLGERVRARAWSQAVANRSETPGNLGGQSATTVAICTRMAHPPLERRVQADIAQCFARVSGRLHEAAGSSCDSKRLAPARNLTQATSSTSHAAVGATLGSGACPCKLFVGGLSTQTTTEALTGPACNGIVRGLGVECRGSLLRV